MSFYLAIVSPLDIPLYETQFQSSSSSTPSTQTTSTGTGFPSWSSFTTSSGADLNADNQTMFTPAQPTQGGGIERHLAQMVAFASLDSVDELLEGTGNLYVMSLGMSSILILVRYLKSVDRHNQWIASAFIATSGMSPLFHVHTHIYILIISHASPRNDADVSVKFVLLHDQKNDDGIRAFFLDLWELYVKVCIPWLNKSPT